MDTISVIVEIPKGSQNKYEYDHEKGSSPTRSAATGTPSTRSCSPSTRPSPAA